MLALSLGALTGCGADQSSSSSTPTGGEPGSPSADQYHLESGGNVLAGPGNQRFRVQPSAVTGFVDSIITEGAVINVTGWAAAPGLSGPARLVVGLVNGQSVGETAPSAKRADVVEAYSAQAIEKSGFALFVETSSLQCDAPAGGLTVMGIAKGVATALPLVGDTEKKLDEAC